MSNVSPPPASLTAAIQASVNGTTLVANPDVLDPIFNSEAWMTYTLNDTPCPGVIDMDGIRGLDRVTEWDRKKGKGMRGAVLTLTQQPLAIGEITSLFWLAEHFQQWADFYDLLTYYANKNALTNAARIEHPALQQNGIKNVVVGKIGTIRHRGKNLYSVTVEYIEWAPPPANSVVSTPISSGGGVTASPVPGAPPPELPNQHAQLAQAQLERDSAASALAAIQ
jgi:hypothetical protein